VVTEPDNAARVLELIKNPEVHRHADSMVVQQLLSNMLPRVMGIWPKPEGLNYMCLEHWVLEHGYFWDRQKLTRKLRKDYDLKLGPIKMCYSTSYEVACENPEVMVYVEGFASGIIPFNHAWNTITTEPKPNMVDLTLRDRFRLADMPETTYFGVPFNLDYVTEVLERKGVHGTIDNWKDNYPLLKNDDLLDKVIHPDWQR
jgi:hypothetical protein